MKFDEAIRTELERLEQTKTFKKETAIESEQGALVRVAGKDVVMLASNNYLGLASHPRIKEAAMRGVREFGFGVSSVRFLCGTLTVHRQLEEKIAQFLGTEDTILFSSCFAANEGFFASITNEKLGIGAVPRCHLQRPAEPCQHHRRHTFVPLRSGRSQNLRARQCR